MSTSSPTTAATSTTKPSSGTVRRHGSRCPGIIFILYVLTLIAGFMEAPMSPIQFFYRDPLAIILYTRCEDDCMLVFHTQFVLSLIMSCMTTICLTTAVAAHPDVPARNETGFTNFKKFLWPIINPEGMLLKAFRQLLAARTIVQLYNEERREEIDMAENQKLLDSERGMRRGNATRHTQSLSAGDPSTTAPTEWTTTHGFYVVMGGLMLYKDDEPLYTLQYSTMESLYRSGQIDLPVLSKRDIMDRSKDGIVSKAMALFQVIYFFQDYARRWKRERSVIDLEIVTMLYILVNALTFLLYWHKPFYILRPTPVKLKTDSDEKTHKKKNSSKKISANSHPS